MLFVLKHSEDDYPDSPYYIDAIYMHPDARQRVAEIDLSIKLDCKDWEQFEKRLRLLEEELNTDRMGCVERRCNQVRIAYLESKGVKPVIFESAPEMDSGIIHSFDQEHEED